MTIFVVKGTDGEALRMVAACLRSVFVNNNKGAIIVDHRSVAAELTAEATDADKATAATAHTKSLLKPLLVDPEAIDAKEQKALPWKEGAVVVVVNEKEAMLDEFEKVAPGFREKYNPTVTVTVEEQT